MPTKKTEDTPAPHGEKSISQRAAVALLKGSGSFALGATVAAVEVGLGESAGKALTATLGVLGLAAEVLLDPLENPKLSEVGKASLHTSGGISGYKVTKPRLVTFKKSQSDKDFDRMVATLKQDMQPSEADGDTKTAKGVPVKKAAPKATKKPQAEE